MTPEQVYIIIVANDKRRASTWQYNGDGTLSGTVDDYHFRLGGYYLDEASRSDTYPYVEVEEQSAQLGHEASVARIGEDQLFYLMSRGLSEAEASAMIVNGFIEPITRELPMEYAVELNRLIELQMEGAIG